jgi:exopolysaccharide biosynthesis polyprenyl glycosylphosphotransferase
MTRKNEILLLILSDFIFVNTAWSVYYLIRIESGWIPFASPASFVLPIVTVYAFWLLMFSVGGLYQHWFVRSRFDEFTMVFKVVSAGCFFLFFVIFLDDALSNSKVISRFLILIYWILMVISVGGGRIIIRSFQMNMLEKGKGLREALIIGSGKRSIELSTLIARFPQLGYKVAGFVSPLEVYPKENFLGSISSLNELVIKSRISEVLIALETAEREKLFDILKSVPPGVHMKILPDTYEIVSGLARTNQIYGVPLIEVMPEIMSYSSKFIKRVIDIVVSVFLLAVLFPVFILIALLIKFTSKGPVLYKQVRSGRQGKEFIMYKFRSMINEAEEYGPEWAGEKDLRITTIGRLIRKIYIDEVPQMINVLKNEMSLVGPRPERPYFVEKLKNEIPYYYKRMSVKPGITGWAQIKHKYDDSLDDVREKLKYDFFYIENMSLKLDFKIMINTILVIVFMKGR